mgnify:CR=1 FL=1
MEGAATIFGVLFGVGILSSAAVLLALRHFKGNISKALGPEFIELTTRIGALDGAIQGAIAYVKPLQPLEQLREAEAELQELQARLEKESKKLATLEAELQNRQSAVDKKESKQNELKQGKEEYEQIADEIRANRERLQSEAEKLQNQLENSKVELASLMTGLDMTDEQEKTMNDLLESLNRSKDHLFEMREVYQQATQRFTNVQVQYQQLELEYRNLLEKQLGATEEAA